MNALKDLELIELFRKGHEEAFHELVVRYQVKVYWIARRFIQDHDLSDDVVQEVLIKVYNTLNGFRGNSSFFTWLYRLTVNISLNTLRKQRVKDYLRIDEFFDLPVDRSEQPDEIVERNEQQDLISHAISTLPKKQKAVFILRYYEELSYEEISHILKTSIGGLKANYFHAMRKIGEYVNRAHRTR